MHYEIVILGAYVPMTMEGDIVVDRVLASCYASAHHDVAHIALTPLRWFPGLTKGLIGEDGGFAVYGKMAQLFAGLLLPVHSVY